MVEELTSALTGYAQKEGYDPAQVQLMEALIKHKNRPYDPSQDPVVMRQQYLDAQKQQIDPQDEMLLRVQERLMMETALKEAGLGAYRQEDAELPYSLESDPVWVRKMAEMGIQDARQLTKTQIEQLEKEYNAEQELANFIEFGGDPAKLSQEAKTMARKQGIELKKETKNDPKSASDAKLIGAASSGLGSLDRIEKELSGKNAGLKMFGASTRLAPFGLDLTPWGRGLESDLFNVVDTILRLRTGAAAPDKEIERYLSQKGPRLTDSKEVRQQKLDALRSELETTVNSMGIDPSSLKLSETPVESPQRDAATKKLKSAGYSEKEIQQYLEARGL